MTPIDIASSGEKTPTWLRLSAFFLGAVLLLWLPIEDLTIIWVIVLAAAINTWFAARFLLRHPDHVKVSLGKHILLGILAGTAVSPLALLLMAFKTGVHGHGAPDFTPDQMWTVITLTPLWTGSGMLLGAGTWLLRLSAHN